MSSESKKIKLNPTSSPIPLVSATQTAITKLKSKPEHEDDINSGDANDCILLNNGVLMPRVGFGTYRMKNDVVQPMIASALQAGYRLIDTAHVYKNGKTETHIGKALETIFATNDDDSNGGPLSIDTNDQTSSSKSKAYKTSHPMRPFILTKVWRSWHGYEDTKICLRRSLKRLKVEQVDLVLIHWPGPGYKTINRSHELIKKYGVEYYIKEGHEQFANLRLETWRALEDAVLVTKQCRSIGVSNFTIQHLKKLLEWKDLRVKPALNQIEMHPYYPQTELRKFCHDHGIAVQAYSSLGGQDSSSIDYNQRLKQPPLLMNPVVTEIGKQVKKTNAQVLLRWAIQHDVAVIPKASSKERAMENINIHDFSLTSAQMDALDALDCGAAGRLTWRRDPMRDLDFD